MILVASWYLRSPDDVAELCTPFALLDEILPGPFGRPMP